MLLEYRGEKSLPRYFCLPGMRTRPSVENKVRAFLRRGRQPEENMSRARTILSPRFLYYTSLMEKRFLAMRMWLCEGKWKVKIAHFRWLSASQKRAFLSSLISQQNCGFIRLLETRFPQKIIVAFLNEDTSRVCVLVLRACTWFYIGSILADYCQDRHFYKVNFVHSIGNWRKKDVSLAFTVVIRYLLALFCILCSLCVLFVYWVERCVEDPGCECFPSTTLWRL